MPWPAWEPGRQGAIGIPERAVLWPCGCGRRCAAPSRACMQMLDGKLIWTGKQDRQWERPRLDRAGEAMEGNGRPWAGAGLVGRGLVEIGAAATNGRDCALRASGSQGCRGAGVRACRPSRVGREQSAASLATSDPRREERVQAQSYFPLGPYFCLGQLELACSIVRPSTPLAATALLIDVHRAIAQSRLLG